MAINYHNYATIFEGCDDCTPFLQPCLQPIQGVLNDLKCHMRKLVHEDSSLLDRPLELQAVAASMINQRQVKGQFERVSLVIDSVMLRARGVSSVIYSAALMRYLVPGGHATLSL